MLHVKKQGTELAECSDLSTNDEQFITVRKKAVWLTAEEEEFIKFVQFHGVQQLAQSLRMIHDLALYHTDMPFDAEEKTALFDLKVLWEGLEKMESKKL